MILSGNTESLGQNWDLKNNYFGSFFRDFECIDVPLGTVLLLPRIILSDFTTRNTYSIIKTAPTSNVSHLLGGIIS
jgi:hypothetical protein